jgi:hypothetical protein
MTEAPGRRPIQVHLRPFDFEHGRHAVEKDVGGRRRRYMVGVVSGTREDAHGERVTPNCIASLSRQARQGDVLLYPDLHGIRASEDIGILDSFRVEPNGDWYVEFRLYDESDGVGADKVSRIDTLWKQVNGLPPYRKPRRKGFSIEGYVPEEKVVLRETQKAIDDMVLEGVVLVPEPAYQDSVAHAVYKALGIESPWAVRKSMRSGLRAALKGRDARDCYERERWRLDSVRDDLVRKAMSGPEGERESRLRALFDEYRDLMVEVIMNSQALFAEADVGPGPDEASPYSALPSRGEVLRRLEAELQRWADMHGGAR